MRQAADIKLKAPMTRQLPHNESFVGRKRTAEVFEWESSKENVLPLKRGRNVTDLNKSLRDHNSFQTKMRLEYEVKAKEDAVVAYDGDDPLAAWIEYVRWLEVKMPEDTRKKFTVLEKCTRELKDNLRYKNDMRYIRLWIQYADLVSNPKDIFKFLYQNKIGERVSLFYIGWAYVLETMANYPQAHKIYLKASQKNAEPQDLLERKYNEFQRRMSRQWLRMTEETGDCGIDEVTHRRALESLSTYGILELNDAQRQQLHIHRASTRLKRIQKENAHKPVFRVYEDPVRHSVDPLDGNSNWKKLVTLQQQDKENEQEPRGWHPNGSRRKNEATANSHYDCQSPLTSRSHVSPLQVFVDDEFSVPQNEPKRRSPLTRRYLTLRQRIDGMATEEEMLAQKPLKNFSAGDKKVQLSQLRKKQVEISNYDFHQTTSTTGEAVSFEENRAHAYQQIVDRRCDLEHQAYRNMSPDVESASNVVLSSSLATSSVKASKVIHEANPTVLMQPAPTVTSLAKSTVDGERVPIVATAPSVGERDWARLCPLVG
ncbi:bub protein kinase [Plasmopara halstedii]|uniref:Bub protein kinase n=1 Tax=Plasmopara halstedii TaxID=4781 RepID=A0A0P1A6B0_PLAHL|nr:bub protein kinase [Plasmopara halstedii]CEG36129.1 bub protein kinase [Plasmopara halstedii]|eukprot:XP_024572498.1 bub protein kinase [Plasmopara halstedii]